tara:strand:- start:484 stop:1209 length:726 start_codon:yes stop_codon:yes gene_type:complete
MLTPPIEVPYNLSRKLAVAVRPFQREYDTITIGEARRLLSRYNFRIPVLCSLSFHKNGNLKHVNIRENLKLIEPTERQFASRVRIFDTPEHVAIDLHSDCLRWIAEVVAKEIIDNGRHQVFGLTDAEIEALLCRISDYAHYLTFSFGDVSPLVIRRILERERVLRRNESNHARLVRHAAARRTDFRSELEEERTAAIAWRDECIAGNLQPVWPHEYAGWPEDERVVLAYRKWVLSDACTGF